ncbi:MAG: CBS domain-containing protein [Streptococcus sp.]
MLIVTGKIVSPFVWILSASTNLLSRLTPMTFDDADEQMTRDEIEYMLTKSEDTLEAEEIEMLQGVFSLDELMAREVMVPRTDAFMIDIEDNTQENIQAILKESFSRIPVCEDDKDKIIGVIHTKNLLKAGFELGFENIKLRRIMNEPLFVPETIFVDDLLADLSVTPIIRWLSCLMSTVALLVLLPSRIFWKKSLVRLTTKQINLVWKFVKLVRIPILSRL